MGAAGARAQLGVELGAEHEGVSAHLGDLDQRAFGGVAGGDQPGLFEFGAVAGVELPAVAVAFERRRVVVEGPGERAGAQQAGVAAEAHCAAQLGHVGLLVEQRDDGAVGVLVGFGGGGGFPAEPRAGEGDDHVLHAAAEAEVGQMLAERVAGDADFALDAARAEAAGDDHAFDIGQCGGDLGLVRLVELVGLEPGDLDFRAALDAGVD